MPRWQRRKGGGMDSFSERVMAAYVALCEREGREISFVELAQRFGRAAGVPPPAPSTLWRWMKGEREPALREIEALALVLGVPPGRLAFGDYVAPYDAMRAAPVLSVKPVSPKRGRKRKG